MPTDHQDCLRCHAPLKEQADSLVTALAGGRGHSSRSSKDNVFASLTIKNTGTGHHFPTYVTPKVVVEAYQENARGERLKGTLREYVIARQVSLDLSKELADTRIAPDEQAVFDYRAPLKTGTVALVLRVPVEPDAFYTDFYRCLLAGDQAGKGKRLINQALEDSLASHFTFYVNRQSLQK